MKKYLMLLLFLLIFPLRGESKNIEYSYNPQNDLFKVPEGLKTRVQFWKMIYTRYTTAEVILHDRDSLNIIYEVIDFTSRPNLSERRKRRIIRKKKKEHCRILKLFARGKINPAKLSPRKRLYLNRLFYKFKYKKKIIRACKTMRVQVGQRDRFIEGLKRSGYYLDKIRQIFRDLDLPEELTVIPHVESSFRYDAYSKRGAAGLWQFIPSTAREQFLKINYLVDQRRDPILASIAAARLLKKKYKELRSWPLTITAYNHGLAGINRAKRAVGSEEIEDIIEKYNGSTFRFASKNFYSEFLAALEVVRNYKDYFGKLKIYPPLEYDILEIPQRVKLSRIVQYFGWSREELCFLNPSLRKPIISSRRYIPRKFRLRVPKTKSSLQRYAQTFKKIFRPVKGYRIKKGETLTQIAARFDTDLNTLKRLNDIKNSSLIYAGRKLKIPLPPPPLNKIKDEISNLITEKTPQQKKSVKSSSRRKKSSGKNIWIKVKQEETLWHYSDWARVSLKKIKRINKFKIKNPPLKIGQKIKIPLSRTSRKKFKQKREEFHRGIEEDFFTNYTVIETIKHRPRKGETIWALCENHEIPYWLLEKYNSETDLQKMILEKAIIIPIVAENKKDPIREIILKN